MNVTVSVSVSVSVVETSFDRTLFVDIYYCDYNI